MEGGFLRTIGGMFPDVVACSIRVLAIGWALGFWQPRCNLPGSRVG